MSRSLGIISMCLALIVLGCGDDSSTTTDPLAAVERQEAVEAKVARKEAQEKEAERKKEEEQLAALPKPKIPTGPPPKSLVVVDKMKGSGKTAKVGDETSVDYIGYVYKTKEMFEANWEDGEPFTFTLGTGEVIAGWDQGLKGMKVGGERELIIPPSLAYGSQGSYPSIPPNATLVFLVKLVDVK